MGKKSYFMIKENFGMQCLLLLKLFFFIKEGKKVGFPKKKSKAQGTEKPSFYIYVAFCLKHINQRATKQPLTLRLHEIASNRGSAAWNHNNNIHSQTVKHKQCC